MLHLKIKTVMRGLPAMNKRRLNQVLKEVWKKVGAFWHAELLKKHFTEAGAAEYGYQPRTADHQRRKQRRFGHQAPLVFTGQMKRQALRERRVSATSKGCKVKLRLPPYAYYHGMAAELTKASRKDRKLIMEFFKKELARELKEARDTRTRTTR